MPPQRTNSTFPDLIPFYEDKIKLRKNSVGNSNFNKVHRLATSSYTDRHAYFEELKAVVMKAMPTQEEEEEEEEDQSYGGVVVIMPCTDDSSAAKVMGA